MKSITKLVVPVHLFSMNEWPKLLAHLDSLTFDVIEWRLDALENFDITAIQHIIHELKAKQSKSLLLTLRTEGEHPVSAYIEKIKALAPMADYLDVEWRQVQGEEALVQSLSEQTQVILSYHEFESKDVDYHDLLHEMGQYPAQHLKLAVTTKGEQGDERLLQNTVEAIQTLPQTISTMSMGADGKWTRMMAPSLGEGFVFAGLGTCCIQHGQLTADQMKPFMEQARKEAEHG